MLNILKEIWIVLRTHRKNQIPYFSKNYNQNHEKSIKYSHKHFLSDYLSNESSSTMKVVVQCSL